MIVCGALHCDAIANSLGRNPGTDATDQFAQISRRGVPIWPILLVIYVVFPGTILGYGVVWAWETFQSITPEA